jgi:regulatory protein
MDDPPSTPTIVEVRHAPRGHQRLITLSDGREFLFSEEACERVHIVEGQAAAEELFGALEAAEQRVLAHEAALRLLAHRPRSRTEMRTRLAMRGVEPAAIDEELERLERAGLLDDEKFARAWVEDRKRIAPRGRRMLRYELLGRGIDPESVDLATNDVDDRSTAVELARSRARKISSPDYTSFFSKIGEFLRRRGFDYEVAADAARTVWAEMPQLGSDELGEFDASTGT